MAERRAKPARDLKPAGKPSSATPEPSSDLQVTLTELAEGTVLHRVHQSEYRADQFNPGVRGNARFSPIQDNQGQAIPTLYAGTTLPCALMETVFHDVPDTAGSSSQERLECDGA
ncbi:MAG: RES family NAD+ phosphorylase [Burkholderiaceae bacterium]